MTKRPRNIANDILDCVETATAKWAKQKKSEERHPGNVHYRLSRMTREPRTTQKDAAWEVMKDAYMAASGNGSLPASARQIYYQARQPAENGASPAEIDILLDERVELNAMTSDALVAMIEQKLQAHGLEKVVPDDYLLEDTYRAFSRSQRLRERFEEMERQFDESAAFGPYPPRSGGTRPCGPRRAHRTAMGRRHPMCAGPGAAFPCASGEGKGPEEVRAPGRHPVRPQP